MTIRTFFNTNESIESVLNFIRKHSYLHKKINSRHFKERKNA